MTERVQLEPADLDRAEMPMFSADPRAARGWRGVVARWLMRREMLTVLLLLIAFVVSANLSPYFLDINYLLDATSLYMEGGIIALAMTLIIISGQIDLSVASTLALVASVTAVLNVEQGVPMPLAMVLGLLLGAGLGAFNGALIVFFRLPSLTVTLGTLALYRGLAQVLIGDHSLSGFPMWFFGIDYRHLRGTPIPWTLTGFLILAVIIGLILHRTTFGRLVYAVGTNPEASRYAGIATGRMTFILFVLSGFLSGVAGLIMTSRLSVARFDMATGLELDVITAVVLGGTDIFGGRGSIFGTVVALFLVGLLRTGMGLANIRAENQLVVIGALLIASIVFSNFAPRLRMLRARPERG